MSVRIRLAPLIVVIQTIRPEVRSTTANLRTRSIEAPKQRQSRLPVTRGTQRVKVGSLTNAKSVRNLVHRRALRHVGTVGAESQIAVVVRFRSRDTRRVGYLDVFRAFRIAVSAVTRNGELHRSVDLRICVVLVGGGVGGLLDGVGEGGARGRGGVCDYGEDQRELHVGYRLARSGVQGVR